MSRKTIAVEDAAKDWFKHPEFVVEFEALETEFAIAEASFLACDEVDLTRKTSVTGP